MCGNMKIIRRIQLAILFILLLNLLLSRLYGINIFAGNQKSSYKIIVDLDDYTMYVYKDEEIFKTYPVSGGAYNTPSPLGTWKIISKADWGEGFGGTWMGFNVPWGKYGIHGTDEPWSIGAPLSKGCIRMYNKDAKELKSIVPVGVKVTIIKGPYGPFGDGFRTLEPGDIGSDVYAVQLRMKELGYYNGWVDGKYGNSMQIGLIKFQKDNGLPISKYINKDDYEAMGIVLFE